MPSLFDDEVSEVVATVPAVLPTLDTVDYQPGMY